MYSQKTEWINRHTAVVTNALQPSKNVLPKRWDSWHSNWIISRWMHAAWVTNRKSWKPPLQLESYDLKLWLLSLKLRGTIHILALQSMSINCSGGAGDGGGCPLSAGGTKKERWGSCPLFKKKELNVKIPKAVTGKKLYKRDTMLDVYQRLPDRGEDVGEAFFLQLHEASCSQVFILTCAGEVPQKTASSLGDSQGALSTNS